jgi:hypothetical protein
MVGGEVGERRSAFTAEQANALKAFGDAAHRLGQVFDADSAWGAAGATISRRVTRSLSRELPARSSQSRSVDPTAVH